MFGQRRVLNIVEEEKQIIKQIPGDGGQAIEIKKWKYFELSGFEWLSWKQTGEIICLYGAGYRVLGLNKGDMLTIFAKTSRDRMFIAMACMSQSIIVTTAYATLGEEGLTYSLQECKTSIIFTDANLLPSILKVTDSEQSYAIALIQPVEKEIRTLAALLNKNPGVDVDHLDFQELCERQDIRDAVLGSLKEVGKKIKLNPAEIVGQVILDQEE
ncbi:long-chain fatty acid-CoA ligase [Physocladia obscura]|uniref:Long-chain fatty acid-CoA ligase n=1 Tax=Physocladia obscura TaxID=109957 RepID=A0AAD5T605_9FUNG|nr:long-chain fatty acid-CoA ligase [Physocladia obscura]